MNLKNRLADLEPGTITTIAGVGYLEGIPARDAPAGAPQGVVRIASGDLIVVDMWAHRIWRIDPDGILHTFGGDGVPGYSGNDGPASEARFDTLHDLSKDKDDNLYLTEMRTRVVRRIDAKTSVVTAVVGSGKVGWGGNGGPALECELDNDSGIAVDDDGNIFICCEWSNQVRRVDAKTGIIEIFAGIEQRHHDLERGNSRPFSGPFLNLGGYSGDGGPRLQAGLHHPEHLAFDSHGDLYICDNSNDRIRKIDMKTGIISTVLGNGQRASNGDGELGTEAAILMPDALCFDPNDNLYVGEKYGFRLRKLDGETGRVSTLAGNGQAGWGDEGFPGPESRINSIEAGIWADPDGTVFWGDSSGRLRRYDGKTGIVTTAFGGTTIHDGGPATEAFLRGPFGISVAGNGDIYFADSWNQRVRAIDAETGVIRTVAGEGARAYGGDGGPATEAFLGNPGDVAVAEDGTVIIADTRHGHVRRIDADGIIHNLAGAAFLWDKGDGGPSISANLIYPTAIEHGPGGDLYIADAAAHRIRMVDAETGIITTVAGNGLDGSTGDGGPAVQARIGRPMSVRFDAAGNLYFCDIGYNVVRRVDAETGIITTVIGCGDGDGHSPDGTPALQASLGAPYGVEVSADGKTIFVSDTHNFQVRSVGPDSLLRTIAGSDDGGDSGDGGPATSATLNHPYSLRLYRDDVLLISDFWNNKLRAVKLG